MTSHNYKSPFSSVQLFVTPWTIACQAPLSMGFSRQEYWSGWPCPSPGDLPKPGIESTTPESPVFAGVFFTTSEKVPQQLKVVFSKRRRLWGGAEYYRGEKKSPTHGFKYFQGSTICSLLRSNLTEGVAVGEGSPHGKMTWILALIFNS